MRPEDPAATFDPLAPAPGPGAQEGPVTGAQVRRLLDEGKPSIVFQPVFDLTGGLDALEVVGFEGLARFPTEASPADWFLAAAEAGWGLELEALAIREAAAHLSHLPDGTYLSVNASPETMTSPAVVEALDGVPLKRVVIEVSEPAVMQHQEAVKEALFGLRALGIRLAVDDVGTGSVSLRPLLRLRPDVIKLDVALTRDIDGDGDRRALAAALAAFAADMGALVVAEGIERPSQLEVLRELRVRYGQGYLLGRPAPLPVNAA